MSESETAASSLARHAQLFDAGAHVVAAAFVDGRQRWRLLMAPC